LIDGPPERFTQVKPAPSWKLASNAEEARFRKVGLRWRLEPCVPAFEPEKQKKLEERNPDKWWEKQCEWQEKASEPKWTWWVVENADR
jgi:hypothetical protein